MPFTLIVSSFGEMMRFCLAEPNGTRSVIVSDETITCVDVASGDPRNSFTHTPSPNQVAAGFDVDQVVVASFGHGVWAYRWPTGDLLWQQSVVPRVKDLFYSSFEQLYYLASEDAFGSQIIDIAGRLEGVSRMEVVAVHPTGRARLVKDVTRLLLLGPDATVCWRASRKGMEVLSVAWSDTSCAFSLSTGEVIFIDVHSGREVWRMERDSWFNVNSLIYSLHRSAFLGIAYGMHRPGAAVIEFDSRRKALRKLKELTAGYNLCLCQDGRKVIHGIAGGCECECIEQP